MIQIKWRYINGKIIKYCIEQTEEEEEEDNAFMDDHTFTHSHTLHSTKEA